MIRLLPMILLLAAVCEISGQSLPTDNLLSPALVREFSVDRLDSNRIVNLPFRENPAEYYQLFSAVSLVNYRQRQNAHVLGGRSDENAYYFEGIDTRSMLTGENLIRFIPEALAQIELKTASDAAQTHAPAAFYHQMRKPSPTLRLQTAAESDRFTGEAKSRLGTYSYGYQNLLLVTEGYIPQLPVGFLVALEQRNFNDHKRRFWEGSMIDGRAYTSFFTGETLEEQSGVHSIEVLPGNIPYSDASATTVNALLTADYPRAKLKVVGAYSRDKRQINNNPVTNTFNTAHIPEQQQETLALSLQGTVNLGSGIDADLQIDRVHASARQYDPVYGDDPLSYRQNNSPRYYHASFYRFSAPGTALAAPEKSREEMQRFSAQLRGTINQHNISAGALYQEWELRRYAPTTTTLFVLNESSPQPLSTTSYNYARFSTNEIFGYDVYGNEIDSDQRHDDGPRHPAQTGIWLQDQIHNGDYQLTLGLRYDRFSGDVQTINDPENIGDLFFDLFWRNDLDIRPSLSKTEIEGVFSPRVSLRGSIGSSSHISFSWGQYAQPAAQQELFTSRDFFLRNFGGLFQPNARGFSLQPVRSSLTSAAISRQFSPELNAGLTFFYRSAEHYPQVDNLAAVINPGDTLFGQQLVDAGTMSSTGFLLDLAWQTSNSQLYLNYQFSKAQGTSSYPSSNSWRTTRNYKEAVVTRNEPLEFQQDHRLNIHGVFRTPDNSPFRLQKIELTSRLHANSGHYQQVFEHYSRFSGDRAGYWLSGNEIRSRRGLTDIPATPWVYWLDAGLSRTFNSGGLAISPYFYVANIFGRKNVQNVYLSTGTTRDGHEQYIYFVGEEDLQLYRILNEQYREHLTGNGASDLFMRPRQIRFGISVEWGGK